MVKAWINLYLSHKRVCELIHSAQFFETVVVVSHERFVCVCVWAVLRSCWCILLKLPHTHTHTSKQQQKAFYAMISGLHNRCYLRGILSTWFWNIIGISVMSFFLVVQCCLSKAKTGRLQLFPWSLSHKHSWAPITILAFVIASHCSHTRVTWLDNALASLA